MTEPLSGFSPGENPGFTLTLAVLRDKVNRMEMEQTTENPCPLCGQPIQEGECVAWEGKEVCPTCLDKKTGIKKTAHKRARWIVAAFVLIAIACGGWFAFGQYQKLKEKAFHDFSRAMEAGRPTEEVMSQLPWWFDVNAKDSDGITPLHIAAKLGNDKVAGALLERGADLNTKDSHFGQTPLHSAIASGMDKIVRTLLNHGADVNAKNDSDWTPLHLAARQDKNEIAQTLIERGADVNAKDDNGWTLLHLAASGGCMNIKALKYISGPFYPDTENHYGMPWWRQKLLLGKEKTALTLILIEHGADVKAKDNDGWTPLHIAAMFDYDKVAWTLIEHGADVNAIDSEGQTPLDNANIPISRSPWLNPKTKDKIITLLRSHGAKTGAELKAEQEKKDK